MCKRKKSRKGVKRIRSQGRRKYKYIAECTPGEYQIAVSNRIAINEAIESPWAPRELQEEVATKGPHAISRILRHWHISITHSYLYIAARFVRTMIMPS